MHSPTMAKWEPVTPLCTSEDFKQGPCFRVNPACTGLKLCPPFNTSSSEGTIGTLDTALNRSRRSTIHCDKRGLCAGEVTRNRTDKTPFMIPPGKRQPSRTIPWKLRFRREQLSQRGDRVPVLTKGYGSSITRVSYFSGHCTESLHALGRAVAHETHPNFVRK